MEKVNEKTIALLNAIDELYFKVFRTYMRSKDTCNEKNPELRSLLRVLDNVQDYLENFKKFTENGDSFDELIKSINHGQENSNGSGQAE